MIIVHDKKIFCHPEENRYLATSGYLQLMNEVKCGLISTDDFRELLFRVAMVWIVSTVLPSAPPPQPLGKRPSPLDSSYQSHRQSGLLNETRTRGFGGYGFHRRGRRSGDGREGERRVGGKRLESGGVGILGVGLRQKKTRDLGIEIQRTLWSNFLSRIDLTKKSNKHGNAWSKEKEALIDLNFARLNSQEDLVCGEWINK